VDIESEIDKWWTEKKNKHFFCSLSVFFMTVTWQWSKKKMICTLAVSCCWVTQNHKESLILKYFPLVTSYTGLTDRACRMPC
jgi:hypothetical protein